MNIKTICAILFLELFRSGAAGAAPCCGGGSSSSLLMTGDEKTQISFSASESSVVGDAPAEGLAIFRSDHDHERTTKAGLGVSTLLAERVQFGGSVSLQRRTLDRPSIRSGATGFGDTEIFGGYEFLPEWTYSSWKPKGFGFLQLTVPTGRSIYEAETLSFVDATGGGFFVLGVGTVWVKRWALWDVSFIPEVHHSFARSFSPSGQPISVGSSWGAKLSSAVGYSPGGGAVRIGLEIQPVVEGSQTVQTADASSVRFRRLWWNTSLGVSVLVQPEWSASLRYLDQTLLGPAFNSSLSRTAIVSVDYRFLM